MNHRGTTPPFRGPDGEILPNSIAEIVFHILPLSILLTLLGTMFKWQDSTGFLWLCIVFAFNLFQVSMFRRYDFVSMYACRLMYSLYWHVL